MHPQSKKRSLGRNRAKTGSPRVEADREQSERERADQAEQQQRAELERQWAEHEREIHEELREVAEVVREIREAAREAAEQFRVWSAEAREASHQNPHLGAAAQAESVRMWEDAEELRRMLELAGGDAAGQRRLTEAMRRFMDRYERRLRDG